jgi:hypothetical protein
MMGCGPYPSARGRSMLTRARGRSIGFAASPAKRVKLLIQGQTCSVPRRETAALLFFLRFAAIRSELENLHAMDPGCTCEASQRAWTLRLIWEARAAAPCDLMLVVWTEMSGSAELDGLDHALCVACYCFSLDQYHHATNLTASSCS